MSSEAFASNAALLTLTDDTPKARLLTTLLAEPADRGLNKTDLADQSGLSRTTVHNHIDDLAMLGDTDAGGVPDSEPPVRKRPHPDGYHVYSINPDSAIAQRLGQLEWAVLNSTE